MSKILSKSDASRTLSNVPLENTFKFCTAEGFYTKVEAISLEDFADKLDGIDAISLLFHYPRGDFQAWIRDTIGDKESADRMCFIKRDLPGEKLRLELLKIVQTRIRELKAIQQQKPPIEIR